MERLISKDNQSFFLATTALEDFWDTTKPVIFLGEWCLRYSRKSFWENLNAKTLAYPLSNPDKFKEASQYADNLYEYLLPMFADKLNALHNEKLSTQAWRIIIGHWLNSCIFMLYDRHLTIRHALKNYPDITTIGLSNESFIIPKDTTDYFCLCISDLYNLQLFTRILVGEGVDFPKKNFENNFVPESENIKGRSQGLLKELIISLFRFSQSLLQGVSPIILCKPYFPLPTVMKIFLKTRGQAVELNSDTDNKLKVMVDYVMRSKLQNLFTPKNDFEKLFMLMIPELIPIIFVENYAYIKGIVQKRYPRNTKVIFSSVSWSGDEAFKVWSAYMSSKGTKLIGAQHGGGYGSEEYFFFENHEATITDRYYTWGWTKDNCRSEVIPGFANKLTGTQRPGINKNEDSILLLSISIPRYSDRPDPRYYHFNEYHDYQIRFIAALGDELRKKLRVRLFVEDCGWDGVARWHKKYPEIALEGWEVKFADSVKQSRICINDASSTTFLEILSWDKPTILFWSNNLYLLRKDARPFYDELRAAGILFAIPEEAAAALRNIYSDVESWWYEPHRQKAVHKFCHHFARTSPDALKYWTDEFNKLARESKRNHLKER